MKPVRAVIWDVDGTLADTIPLIVSSLRVAIIEHGGPEMTDDEITALFGPTEEGVLRNLLGDAWEPAIETYLREYEDGHDVGVLSFNGVANVVRDLQRRGVPMAVVTGKGERSARITLEQLGYRDVFETVASGSMGGAVKAEKISAIVAAWGIDPADVAYVGDHPADVRDSRTAGVRSVVAAWKPDARPDEMAALHPDVLLLSEADLEAWARDDVRP